jgi:glycosyltransferase involved in cell wall biosynthesis
MNILFFDGVTPKPYTLATLDREPMGGTEATVIRVAEALGAKGHHVFVAQHNAQDTALMDMATYGMLENYGQKPDVIICLREPGYLKDLRASYPDARMFLWLHDLPSPRLVEYFYTIVNTDTQMVAVSHWHAEAIKSAFASQGLFANVKYIYNPIADDLKPMSGKHDPYSLAFMSSPHKGLKRTLEVFQELRNRDKRYTLHVANPGYLQGQEISQPGVVDHGPLTHTALMALVSGCVAVMHLNDVFPETFGIVHAEANALGVPFLTDFSNGAVQELIDHPQEMINVKDTEAVIKRTQDWSEGRRPKVYGNPLFRLARVVGEWISLLDGRR